MNIFLGTYAILLITASLTGDLAFSADLVIRENLTLPQNLEADTVTVDAKAQATVSKSFQGKVRRWVVLGGSKLIVESNLLRGEQLLIKDGVVSGLSFSATDCRMGRWVNPEGGNLVVEMSDSIVLDQTGVIDMNGAGHYAKGLYVGGPLGCMSGGENAVILPSGYSAGGGGGFLTEGKPGRSLVFEKKKWRVLPGGKGGPKISGGAKHPEFAFGSSGGTGTQSGYEQIQYLGGRGGGGILLQAQTIEIRGLLSARGLDGVQLSGGGSGGSIKVVVTKKCIIAQAAKMDVKGGVGGKHELLVGKTKFEARGGDGSQGIIEVKGPGCTNQIKG